MRAFRIKPRLKAININVLLPDRVEYICTTQVIDKEISEQKSIRWDQDLADKMEEATKFYFVVLKNMEYDVIADEIMDPWFEKYQYDLGPQTEKAKSCMYHFIKSLN